MKLIFANSYDFLENAKDLKIFAKDISYFLELNKEGARIDLGQNRTLFIEGELYYYLDSAGESHPINISEKDSLARIFNLYGIQEINNFLEGIFSYVIVDSSNKVAFICTDKFNRKDIFYRKTKGGYIFSSDINDLIEDNKMAHSNFSVACMLSINYTPSRHTIYENIFKIGVGEVIKLEVNGHEIKFSISSLRQIRKISAEEDKDFGKFYGIFRNSVLSRSSKSENYIQLSGGIDSTFILDCLLKEYDSTNVKAICAKTVDKSGKWLNYADVNRPILIAKHYGIKLELVEQRLAAEYNLKYWELAKKRMKNEFMFNSLHYRMAERLKTISGENAAILNGEASDSLFNFGFTQRYFYDKPKIKSYLEKMRSYFYGPTFFKKVLDHSAESDIFLNIFKLYRGGKYIFSEKMDIFEYLFSFIFSEERLPFARSVALSNVLFPKGQKNFKEWINDNYFKEILEDMNQENIYSCLIDLYLNFHLQGANIKGVFYAMREYNLKIRMPFLDLLIVRYLSSMPEKYGRGLEFRSVKYPLYFISRRSPNFPMRIIRDISGEINYSHTRGKLFKKWICDSSLTPRLRQLYDSRSVIRDLDAGFFNTGEISRILDNFSDNNCDYELLFRIFWILELMR